MMGNESADSVVHSASPKESGTVQRMEAGFQKLGCVADVVEPCCDLQGVVVFANGRRDPDRGIRYCSNMGPTPRQCRSEVRLCEPRR